MKVFLGGTCNESEWRQQLIPRLDRAIDAFDPVVSDWNDEAQRAEREARAKADYVVYALTPRMHGVYSIAEVVDDANRRPQQTVFTILTQDGEHTWDDNQLKSLQAVRALVERRGAKVFDGLTSLATWLNQQAGRAHDSNEPSS